MNILLAPDSMKDSLSAVDAAKVMKQAIAEVCPSAEVVSCPLSDGGEGLIEILLHAGIGEKQVFSVEDPLGRRIDASFIDLKNGVYVMEMAQVAGLELLKNPERNPLYTSTRGIGQLIKHMIDRGAKQIYMGLGGSATHDLGCGMAQALGVRFYNREGEEIDPVGGNLVDISRIDFSNATDLHHVEFVGLTDVKTLLLGMHGAAVLYAPQKGAGIQDVTLLEKGSVNLVKTLKENDLVTAELLPGSGAAGGLGFGLVTFLNGNLLIGLSVVGSFLSLEEKVKQADVVITLEGKTDQQTWEGKLPYRVASLAKKYHKNVLHFTGAWDRTLISNAEGLFDVVIPIQDKPMTTEESIRDAPILLKNAIMRSFQLINMSTDNTRNNTR